MRDGGTLVFTVEALADDVGLPFRLEPHGRYAHARGHIEAVLSQVGLRVLEISAETLRNEGGNPVHGWLVAARKP